MPLSVDNIIVIGSTLLSTAVGCGSVYGIIKTKIARLEKDLSELENRSVEEHESLRDKLDAMVPTFVTMRHFEAVVQPIQDSMKEIEKDIKKILTLVSTRNLHEE